MTEDETGDLTPRLWTAAGFTDDIWVRVDELQPGQPTILPLAAFLELDSGIRAANLSKIGVELQPGDALEKIADYLPELPMIALAFGAFSDGRSYSKAELLRSRYGYVGRVRATGDVLIDQIALMLRTGFDEFVISDKTALKRLEEGMVGGIPYHYQPAAKPAAGGASYAWRRLPA